MLRQERVSEINDSSADGLGTLAKQVAEIISTLVRKEIQLAREETTEIIREKAHGAAAAVIALTLTVLLVPFALLTFIEVIAIWWPRWAATLTVTGAMIIIGGAVGYLGYRKLKSSMVPKESIASIKEDIEWAKTLKN